MRLALLLLCSLGAFASVARSQVWPQWGGPQRNFTVEDSGLAEVWPADGPRLIWRRNLGDGYSGIVNDKERLFTLYREGGEDVLAALDSTDGRMVWRQSWPAIARDFMDTEFGPGPHSTPLVAGANVFAVGVTGRLVAVERETGRLVWTRELWAELEGTPLERGYAASPIAFGDLVILPVGGPNRSLVAFRQSDGAIAWQTGDFDIAYSSPILVEVRGELQLIALLRTEVIGLDPATGRLLWMVPVSDERFVNVASPLFTLGNLLYFDAAEGSRVLRLDRVDGRTQAKQLWLDKVIGSQVGNVIRVGDHLYGTLGRSSASFTTAVHVETGEMAWRTREIGDCTLVVVGERVIALEGDGTLRLLRLSPDGLETVSSARILTGRSWTAPTLVGTTLFARNRQELVALDLGELERDQLEDPITQE